MNPKSRIEKAIDFFTFIFVVVSAFSFLQSTLLPAPSAVEFFSGLSFVPFVCSEVPEFLARVSCPP